jgi:hypothetical protein
MKLPSMLYGRAGAVKSRAKKKLKEIVEKRTFDDLDCGPLLDTSEVSGLLLVEPERIQSPGEHFHCYALTLAVFDLVPASEMFSTMAAWIKWSLLEPWRFLGVVEQHSVTALAEKRELLFPYVEAAARFWPELRREGKRYGPFVNEPQEVWGVMDNLKYALANLGIANDDLQVEPPGGPTEFLTRIQRGAAPP